MAKKRNKNNRTYYREKTIEQKVRNNRPQRKRESGGQWENNSILLDSEKKRKTTGTCVEFTICLLSIENWINAFGALLVVREVLNYNECIWCTFGSKKSIKLQYK